MSIDYLIHCIPAYISIFAMMSGILVFRSRMVTNTGRVNIIQKIISFIYYIVLFYALCNLYTVFSYFIFNK